MKAVRLKQVDEDYRQHAQAFLNFQVQATTKQGKPVYKRFTKFYDYEKEQAKAKGETSNDGDYQGNPRFKNLSKHLKEVSENG